MCILQVELILADLGGGVQHLAFGAADPRGDQALAEFEIDANSEDTAPAHPDVATILDGPDCT